LSLVRRLWCVRLRPPVVSLGCRVCGRVGAVVAGLVRRRGWPAARGLERAVPQERVVACDPGHAGCARRSAARCRAGKARARTPARAALLEPDA